MLSCCRPDLAAPRPAAVAAAARTGDLYLFARRAPRPAALAALLSALPCAVACADGVRESPVDFDTVAVVVEHDDNTPELLLYNQHTGELLFVALATLEMRGGACMRPLLTEQTGNDQQCAQRRRQIRTLLLAAVDDIVNGDATLDAERAVRSPAYLTAYLLYRAGVLTAEPARFCGVLDGDIDYLFGSDAQHLDRLLTAAPADYGYGHQVWITRR